MYLLVKCHLGMEQNSDLELSTPNLDESAILARVECFRALVLQGKNMVVWWDSVYVFTREATPECVNTGSSIL